jgi:hypothetical protein
VFQGTGIDLGSSGTRKVNIGRLMGSAQVGEAMSGPSAAAVPSDVLTYRKVALPPANQTVCRRVIQEELSYSLPFPMHQVAWDYIKAAGQSALVMVTPRERLSSYQRLAGNASLDAEPLAYLRAALHCGIHNGLLIDFGASKTTFCHIAHSQLEWVRVMLRGGRQLTQRLADENKLQIEQAEDLKRKRGCELGEVQNFVAELIEEALLDKHTGFEQVLIFGGGSAMPGLKSFLSLRLGTEPQAFPVPPSLSPYQHVTALGAALSLRLGQPRIQLQNPTEASGTPGFLPWVSLSLLGLGGLFAVGYAQETKVNLLTSQQAVLRQDLVQSVKPWLPDSESVPSEQLLEKTKSTVASRKKLKQQSVRHVADSLARMATTLREMPKVEVRSITYDEGKVQFEGEVASPQEAEQLRAKLGKVFPDLQQVRFSKGVADRFIYQFEGKLPQP